MALATKKSPQESMADKIRAFRAELDRLIDAKVDELKKSPDGQSQPVAMLRRMLTRGDDCQCRAALRMLGE